MITAGIDMGSRSVKVVLLEEIKVDGAPQLNYAVKKAHLMLPGDIVSERPVSPEKASRGNPHSGPCTRGKSTNSSSMKGVACSSMTAVSGKASIVTWPPSDEIRIDVHSRR